MRFIQQWLQRLGKPSRIHLPERQCARDAELYSALGIVRLIKRHRHNQLRPPCRERLRKRIPQPRGISTRQRIELVLKAEQLASRVAEPLHRLRRAQAVAKSMYQGDLLCAQAQADAKAQGQPAPRFEDIGLRQRCKPFMDMLARCHKAGQPIVWGVP